MSEELVPVPQTEEQSRNNHELTPIPAGGELIPLDTNANTGERRNLNPTLFGSWVNFMSSLTDIAKPVVDYPTRGLRNVLAESAIKLKKSKFGEMSAKVGSGALEGAIRTQGAMVAGQRILIRTVSDVDPRRAEIHNALRDPSGTLRDVIGTRPSTSDLITPFEVILGYDFRDEELEEMGKIMLSSKDVPGQKEIMEEFLTEEQMKNLQENPLLLFGLPMEGKFDKPTEIINKMRWKEYVVPEDGQFDFVITQEQTARLLLNLGNDAFLPFGWTGKPTRGVRNIRHLPGMDKVDDVAEAINTAVSGVKKSIIRAIDDASPPVPFSLADVPLETVSKLTRAVADFKGGSPSRIWQGMSEGVAKLDPENAEDVLKFRSMIDELSDGISIAGKADLQDGTGTSLARGVDWALSNHKFTEFVDTLSSFGQRAGMDDVADLRKFRLSDSLAGADVVNRPVAILPDGRVLYHQTTRGQDFTPLKNKSMRILYRALTGKSFEAMDTTSDVGWITSRYIQEAESSVPTLVMKLQLPPWVPGRRIREEIVDQFQNTLGILDASARASKFETGRVLADARRLAKRKAEVDVYRKFGIQAPESLVGKVEADDAILAAGRARIDRMTSQQSDIIRNKIAKGANKLADEAEDRALAGIKSQAFDLSIAVDIGTIDGRNARKVVNISKGDITGMLTKNKSLREYINVKAPLRGTRAIVDPITSEVRFVSSKAKTLPETILESLEDSLKAGRKLAKEKPTIGNLADSSVGVRGSVDDVIENIAKPNSKIDEIFELDTELTTGSGGGKHPRPPDSSDAPVLPTPSDGPLRLRDLTIFGWGRDPEQVFRGTGIFEELMSAELGMFRTHEVLSSVINSRMGWLKAGSPSARRIGRTFLGKSTDIDGAIIKLTDQEDEAVRIIKSVMDSMMESGGHKKADDIREYFAILMANTGGKKPKILPQLLDTPLNGNAFYSHLIPNVKGAPKEVSYDIVETLRTFIHASNQDLHMAPAIKRAKDLSDEIDLPKWKRTYLNWMTDRIQGKPTKLGQVIDEGVANAIEQAGLTVLFRPIERAGKLKFRLGTPNYANPATRASLGMTRAVYRGFLGGSVGFVVKNTAQVINTVAEVGPWHTLRGIARMHTPSGVRTARNQKLLKDFNQLFEEVSLAGTMDDWLFKPVQGSEFLNRGIAFHAGVSAEASKLGMPMREIMQNPELAMRVMLAGHTVAQRTQFIYGMLGRSPIFSTGAGRIFGQFMTFPIKQSEFILDKVKRDKAGLLRFLAATGYASRLISEAGVDPTGFVGFGFVPQGIEPGVPLVLPAGLQLAYHGIRFSNSMAEDDLAGAEKWKNRIGRDMLHLIPAGLQMDKTATAISRFKSMRIETEVGDLVRPLSDREKFMQFFGVQSIESKITREQAGDMLRQQKTDAFARSTIIRQLLDTHEDMLEAQRKGVSKVNMDNIEWQKLVSQAIAWGLPISSEGIREAAERRVLSTYLRKMDSNKKIAVMNWNRYILEIPGEPEKFGFQPISPDAGEQFR